MLCRNLMIVGAVGWGLRPIRRYSPAWRLCLHIGPWLIFVGYRGWWNHG